MDDDTTFTPSDPDATVTGFVSLTGKVHLSADQSWGANPACSSKFARGTATAVQRNQITCLRCQQALVDG